MVSTQIQKHSRLKVSNQLKKNVIKLWFIFIEPEYEVKWAYKVYPKDANYSERTD